jgi:hypothetical protein
MRATAARECNLRIYLRWVLAALAWFTPKNLENVTPGLGANLECA